MHIDLNSCFATIEQQANPLLRGKPIAICAYTTPRGCILAPSIEAKRYGVKTGMRVMEGIQLCPKLIVMPSDPPKYRFVNRALLKLFNQYTPDVSVRSIDEMLLNFSYLWVTRARDPMTSFTKVSALDNVKEADSFANDLKRGMGNASGRTHKTDLKTIAQEIKTRIKSEIGDWLTVSIGISTNPYLAKLAAGFHKPDGLDEINSGNIIQILTSLNLTDLPYIKERNSLRLLFTGVKTPLEFYRATLQQLKSAFQSINGYYWYLRLHGFVVDNVECQRKSIGHSYALPKSTNDKNELEQLLYKLVEKMGRRLRNNHLTTQGIHLACNYADGSFWHQGLTLKERIYASSDLFTQACYLFKSATPLKPVRILAVSCFTLQKDLYDQQMLFAQAEKKRRLVQALDTINNRWGEFSVMPCSMLTVQQQNKIVDRIAFGRMLDASPVVLQNADAWEREQYFE